MSFFSKLISPLSSRCRTVLLAGVVCLVSACDNTEFIEASKGVFQAPASKTSLSVTFLGTSSFLFQTPQEQVLIDGYVSRVRHNLVKRIAPDLAEIHKWIERLQLCKAHAAKDKRDQPDICADTSHPKLSLILTLHGHYDHGMDAPYIGGWSAAPMLRDLSLDRQWDATKAYISDVRPSMTWQSGPRLDVADYVGTPPRRLPVSSMDIRLFETAHNENIISRRIKHVTPADFEFPSRIWDMGEGTAVSALIKTDGKKILIVGSSGNVGTVFKDNAVKADVVFLSIGGLGAGFAKPEMWTDYWNKTVRQVGAKRVFMIHWDEHQDRLPDAGGHLVPTFYEPHEKVFTHLQHLAQSQGVSLRFPPVGRPFDPFHKMVSGPHR